MTHAIMSNTDYKGICDTVRAKTETSALLKSAEVAPAIRSIELGGTSLMLTVTTEAGATVTATKGSLSVTAVATNGTATLKLKEAGEWTVTATLNGETSTVVVSVSDSYEITFEYLPPVGTKLENMSWRDISRIAKAGLASTYFKVGDTKRVQMEGNFVFYEAKGERPEACIIGIDHNAELEGANLIHFQLGKTSAFCDSKDGATTTTKGAFTMNTSATNVGGWEKSQMRTDVCGTNLTDYPSTSIIGLIPEDLRAVIAPVVKYTDNVANGNGAVKNNVTATTDYFFLLSEFEVFGNRNNANTYEQDYQKQYDYFAAGNSTAKTKNVGGSSNTR